MMIINKALRVTWPTISQLPDETFISDCHFLDDENAVYLSLQIRSWQQFGEVRKCFPGAIWKRCWEAGACNWWVFDADLENGWHINIYAVQDNPHCKAIIEKKMVTVQEPVEWKSVIVEREIITGWDCKDGADTQKP